MDTTFGDFVRRVRTEREVPLTSLPDVGASSMSRFEHNQLDLVSSRLVGTLGLIGVDFRDLSVRHLLPVANDDDWQYLTSARWNLQRVKKLRETLSNFNGVELSAYRKMILAIIDELIFLHEGGENRRLSSELVHNVTKYFAGLSRFSGIDVFLLGAIIDYTDVKTSMTWVLPKAEKIQRTETKLSSEEIRNYISLIFMVAEQAGSEKRLNLMSDILAQAKQLLLLVPEQVSVAYNYSVNVALLNLLRNNDTSSRLKFVRIIESTRVIFPKGYYEYFRAYVLKQKWVSKRDFDYL